MSSRDVAILGGSDLEPDYGNLVWNCPVCGRFLSERSTPHPDCAQAMELDAIQQERAWAEGW